jgi:hypothetical protein
MTRPTYMSWIDSLPATHPFDRCTPVDAVRYIQRALRLTDANDPHDRERAVLDAGAEIRTWWKSLPNQGTRVDAYPLVGDAYLWSALKLVAVAAGGSEDDAGGEMWNVLRRAEANLRAWWVARMFEGGAAVVIDWNTDADEYVKNSTAGTSTTTTAIANTVMKQFPML